MSRTNNKGFTIVELLFSTTVFSIVLLLCLTALVQIGRMYYKGVTTSQTQTAARALLDEVSQSIQFSGAGVTPPASLDGSSAPVGPTIAVGGSITASAVGYFCVGATRYTFVLDRVQDSSAAFNSGRKAIRHVLWADEPGVCNGATPATMATMPVDLTQVTPSSYNGRDLLGDNMRLIKLKIAQPSVAGYASDSSTWMVQISVAYGEDDLLVVDSADSTRRHCKGAQIGTQFCAVSELSTIVKRRVQ